VGAISIPLTFLVARRFTGERSALFAGALVAILPSLIVHVTRLYSEVVYTPLLLLAMLSLLRAIEQPWASRFAWAGGWLATGNLSRSTGALFPVVLPLILPWSWSVKRRLIFSLIYGGAMALVIAPWTYHNYRTHHVFLPLSVSIAALWQGSPEFYHLMEQ